jgi:nucleoside-diphosphate-sugar epimerase
VADVAQRDFIHVQDVAGIVAQLLRLVNSYSLLNIGTGVATKIGDIVRAVQEAMPEFGVSNSTHKELEYSRADIGRLNKIMKYKFVDIMEFNRMKFVPMLKEKFVNR